DFSTCKKLDKSFVSKDYQETESDIIYEVKFRGQKSYLVVLIEFQSTVAHFMALRVLNYITNFYMDYLESNSKIKHLPPIFPIVLYNGDRKWTAPVNLSELIKPNDLLGKYALNFEYCKIAINEYSQENLLKIKNIISTLFLAENKYDMEQLEQELMRLFQHEPDKQAISLFLNWFKQLAIHGRIDKNDYSALEKVYSTTQEVSMLLTSLKQERQTLVAQGVTQGISQGVSQTAKRMLDENIDISLITKVTQLSEQEILQLKTNAKGTNHEI
ncbi:MAG: Rpn family recombination-promoting nuclease/putative transposase, partial [Thiomargarita sp.]|nr:Rpn family recombination-promoting nuclease/putative transposase [Thiomargarita sp.]